ncbi:SAM-dependent methyltransferase [Alicyclobacillus acidiphilus]|uniref:SAM-dependent methyltransferase n=1 Tax=Alicyclobacillus acidiphilus TaxID=182455 RepID=UPI00082DC262|nr:methyltransferase domain-containing protein [Alicyclobacillus acidiphilus]
MSMETYDEVYRKPEFYWGKEPNELCRMAIDACGLRGGNVIDLGCGEGKDMIHFAKHGFRSVGVDVSLPGLEKAERWAAEEGLAITTIHAHLDDFALSEMYDMVYSSGALTYLHPQRRDEKFENYKACTRVGGLNVFNAFVEKPFLETPPDWGTDEYFYRSGDLLRYYWDWEILAFEEVIFDCNSSGVPHKHAMDVLIARRIR